MVIIMIMLLVMITIIIMMMTEETDRRVVVSFAHSFQKIRQKKIKKFPSQSSQKNFSENCFLQ